jgi:HAD superfamily hydrolase (TIGR01509 family)
VGKAVRNVVFDIGWVLVDLDYAPLTRFLREHGADVEHLRDVAARIGLERHESGEICGDELLDNLARLGSKPMNPAALRQRWLEMFVLQVPMVALARRLAEHHQVHLLSNVGDLHWAYLSREYGLHRIGHGALPSFVAGVMKPEPRIYAEAERRFDLDPRATVFIDDLPANVESARRRGWHGIEHSDYDRTVRELARLGVAI